jgi:hypothetical protein
VPPPASFPHAGLLLLNYPVNFRTHVLFDGDAPLLGGLSTTRNQLASGEPDQLVRTEDQLLHATTAVRAQQLPSWFNAWLLDMFPGGWVDFVGAKVLIVCL